MTPHPNPRTCRVEIHPTGNTWTARTQSTGPRTLESDVCRAAADGVTAYDAALAAAATHLNVSPRRVRLERTSGREFVATALPFLGTLPRPFYILAWLALCWLIAETFAGLLFGQ